MIRNINRGALIITPTAQFHQMISSLLNDQPEKTESISDHDSSTVYLIDPELDLAEGVDEYLEQIYREIAVSEIEAWIEDTTLWPKEISWENFREWFAYSFQSLIFDIMEDDIMYEDEYEEEDYEDDDYEEDEEDFEVDYEDEDE